MDDRRLQETLRRTGYNLEVGAMQARHEALKSYMRITNRMFFLFFFGFLNTAIGSTLVNFRVIFKIPNQNLFYVGAGLVGLAVLYDLVLIRMSLRYEGLRKGYPIILTITLILAFGIMLL